MPKSPSVALAAGIGDGHPDLVPGPLSVVPRLVAGGGCGVALGGPMSGSLSPHKLLLLRMLGRFLNLGD